jgi:hypothetical protein
MTPISSRTALVAAASLVTLSATLAPTLARACACGCGVFSVGAGNLMPDGTNGTLFLEYDFMNQSKNWNSGSSAPGDSNEDKKIKTDFITVGGQYRVARDWTVTAEVPVWNRTFVTDNGNGLATYRHAALGDVRLLATYTGLSRDMSLGLIAGVKLPTGDHTYANFDPDTEISTGSTDVLLGAYRQGTLNRNGDISYFVQGIWDKPVDWRANYRPGEELNLAAGVSWAGWSLAGGRVTLAPVVQVISSIRARDHGASGHPTDSGYERAVLAPGLELQSGPWRVFADVAVPVYQRVNGNQLTAPVLFKAMLTRSF